MDIHGNVVHFVLVKTEKIISNNSRDRRFCSIDLTFSHLIALNLIAFLFLRKCTFKLINKYAKEKYNNLASNHSFSPT